MKVSATRKCLQTKKHIPIGGKRHHINQSQNYMANHVIWLLRNRGSCGRDGGKRVTAAVTETVRFVTYSVFEVYS